MKNLRIIVIFLIVFAVSTLPFVAWAQTLDTRDSDAGSIFKKTLTEGEEVAEYEEEEEDAETITKTNVGKYVGLEGIYLDKNESAHIFTVRYYDENRPELYDDVTFFYDENTVVEYKDKMDVEDLRYKDKIIVFIGKEKDKTVHFNITRLVEHLATKVELVEKRDRKLHFLKKRKWNKKKIEDSDDKKEVKGKK